MREKLMSLDETGNPIRVAIIGCGRFGSMMVSQIKRAPGMTVSIVCDIDDQKAADALATSGYDSGTIITQDTETVFESDVDVVVEATGNPDVGAFHAFRSISEGKHVVNVNVESDVLVGPVLHEMAELSGVVYSLAYGDQPAVIEDLYDWAVSMGFEVVAAGKGTMYLPEFRKGTPDDALVRYGYSESEATNGDLNARMYNSFLDGTKSAVEMCAVANMTGLLPDVAAMHFPPASVEELPGLLVPKHDGGILSSKGVVEVVSCLRRDGSDIPNSLRWGVYVVVTTDSPYLLRCLNEYGMPMDSSGKYAAMYRPYHLVGMEAPVSIAKAYLYNEPTGTPKSRVGEVVAKAKRRLEVGEILDGEGGFTVYGVLVDAEQADRDGLLPIGLCHGAKVNSSVDEDQMVRSSDVTMPESGFAYHLREVQRAKTGFA